MRQPETVEDPARLVTQTFVAEGVTVEVTRVVVETIVTETTELMPSLPEESPMLVVCQPEEPRSLYWYGDRSLAATAV